MSKSQETVITEDDDLFKELEEEIEFLHSVQLDLVSKNMDGASFTDFDAEFLAIQLSPSDTKITGKLLETEDVSNDNDDAIKTEDEPVYCPDRNEHLYIIETLAIIASEKTLVDRHPECNSPIL